MNPQDFIAGVLFCFCSGRFSKQDSKFESRSRTDMQVTNKLMFCKDRKHFEEGNLTTTLGTDQFKQAAGNILLPRHFALHAATWQDFCL